MRQTTGKLERPRLSPRTLGLIFLVPGLLVAIPSLMTGTFTGGVMGFCMVTVLGGAILAFVPLPERR